MSLLVPGVGEVEMLKRIVGFSATGNLILHLFTNNYTPVEGEALTAYTECTATGYAAKTLTGASWTITAGAPSLASYAAQAFALTAAATIYGYYVTNLAGTVLMWGERLDSVPYNIPAGGGSVTITPKFSLE